MARPATAMSCTGRVVLVRLDRDADGKVIDSQLVGAWHRSEIDVDALKRNAAAAKAEPVAGAVVVEVEVVEL